MDRYEDASDWSDDPPKLSERELLEWSAGISGRAEAKLRRLEWAEAEAKEEARRECELLEFTASISGKPEHERELRAVLKKEAEERESQERQQRLVEAQVAHEAWDPSKHPRLGGPPNAGWWASTGETGGGAHEPSSHGPTNLSHGPHAAKPANIGRSASPGSAELARDGSTGANPFQTAAFRPGQSHIQLTATGGAAGNWPTVGPVSPWLPKVGAAGASAGAAAGIAAGGFLAGLRNASMGAYWARVPGTQAMPSVWVYELEKRVRAGTLSREDAKGIFNTAVLGAQAQGFEPTGKVMSAVRKSITDFLGKAEEVYFARKKEKGWATQPGGYQQSGGRVFPTKRNSGLDGYALRQEQEKFFETGLSQGKLPGELRGQAAVAGSKRADRPDDHLIDPEAEAALQRAIRNAAK